MHDAHRHVPLCDDNNIYTLFKINQHVYGSALAGTMVCHTCHIMITPLVTYLAAHYYAHVLLIAVHSTGRAPLR